MHILFMLFLFVIVFHFLTTQQKSSWLILGNHTNKAMCYCVLGHKNLAIIVAVASASLALLLIVATVVFFVRTNLLKRRRGIYVCTKIILQIVQCLNFRYWNLYCFCLRKKTIWCTFEHGEQVQTKYAIWNSWKGHRLLQSFQ